MMYSYLQYHVFLIHPFQKCMEGGDSGRASKGDQRNSKASAQLVTRLIKQ